MAEENQGAGPQEGEQGTAKPVVEAPATDPVKLPIVEKTPEPKAGELVVVAYDATGDAGLDMALDFVGKFGIGPEDPAMAAAADGNFDLLAAKFAAMGAKAQGYEKFLALGKASYAAVQATAKATSEKNAEAIYNVVGGKERWETVKTWAGKEAEPEEQTAVNAALNAGGMQAKAMAMYLDTLFDKASGVTVKGRSAVSGNAAGGAPANGGALSPRAYTAEAEKLSRKLGGRLDGSPEYKQLQARRAAWRQ